MISDRPGATSPPATSRAIDPKSQIPNLESDDG